MGTKTEDIEKEVIKAAKLTIKDYKNQKLQLEEDMRAAFYHHLRPFIDKSGDLKMLLSHDLQFKQAVIKPDLTILRNNEYLIGIEFKMDGLNTHTLDKGKDDINRLKNWKADISKGYFIHFDL